MLGCQLYKYEIVHVTHSSNYIAQLECPLLTQQTACASVLPIGFALVRKLARHPHYVQKWLNKILRTLALQDGWQH